MTNTKMTNANALSFVLSNCEVPADVQERLEAMLATLTKRAEKAKTAERKPTAKQVAEQAEREAFRVAVTERMAQEPNREFTCKELADLFEVSCPKMANALTKLVADGKALRLVSNTNKAKVWFKVAA